jgi:hypothetical protein
MQGVSLFIHSLIYFFINLLHDIEIIISIIKEQNSSIQYVYIYIYIYIKFVRNLYQYV